MATTTIAPKEMLATQKPKPGRSVLSTAERAECTCPDYCDRDHDRD